MSAGELLDAARKDNTTQVARLLASGADVNERDRQHATPLHWLAFHGREAMVKALIDAGARVDATLTNGSTPLHLAAYKGHTAVARILLDSGANTSARNRDGITPLDWARRHRHQATVDLLSGGGTMPQAGITAPQKPQNHDERTLIDKGSDLDARSRRYRVQLIAVRSEERARKAIDGFQGHFADILQNAALVVERVDGSEKPLFRVQSGPMSPKRAEAMCDQLRRRDQPCLVRATRRP